MVDQLEEGEASTQGGAERDRQAAVFQYNSEVVILLQE